ncbi:MAG: hypothetical protein V5A24_08745 [Haloarculaceae archaeon]
MADDDGKISQFLKSTLRGAGRQVEEAKTAYGTARDTARVDLPTDDEGRARLICRRYAEERAVEMTDGRPECYEADHPDCEGCVEDIATGQIEIW